jgi:hypothetical protein
MKGCVVSIALLTSCVVAAEGVASDPISSFAGLEARLRPGERVVVTQYSGDVVRGRVVSIVPLTVADPETGESLGTASLELAEADVERLTVLRKDSLWNGALIGLGVGGAVVFAADCNSPDCDRVQPVVVPLTLALGVGLGALFDFLKKEEKLLYAADSPGPQVFILPVIDRDRRGALVTLRWGR